MPRYTRCPYYIDENKLTISCEDVCRTYDSINEKLSWMDLYCDSWDWMRCPYAADRSEAYKKIEEGDAMALEEQKDKATKNEIKSLQTKLGRLTKKVERMQKKIDELRAVNQSYTRVNQNLEKQKADFYAKWRSAESRVRAQDDAIWNEISSLASIYEQRMAYLIDTYCPDKKLRERDVEDWAKDRAYAIVATKIEDEEAGIEGEPAWKVVFQEEEEENEDGEHVTEGISGADRTEA